MIVSTSRADCLLRRISSSDSSSSTTNGETSSSARSISRIVSRLLGRLQPSESQMTALVSSEAIILGDDSSQSSGVLGGTINLVGRKQPRVDGPGSAPTPARSRPSWSLMESTSVSVFANGGQRLSGHEAVADEPGVIGHAEVCHELRIGHLESSQKPCARTPSSEIRVRFFRICLRRLRAS